MRVPEGCGRANFEHGRINYFRALRIGGSHHRRTDICRRGLVDPTETGDGAGARPGQLRRQDLYKEFIDEASKTYADALKHDKADVSTLVGIYTRIGRMRVLSSPKVVESAEQVALAIVDQYLAPNVSFPELRDLEEKGGLDPLRVFAEACRAEFLGRLAPEERMKAWQASLRLHPRPPSSQILRAQP